MADLAKSEGIMPVLCFDQKSFRLCTFMQLSIASLAPTTQAIAEFQQRLAQGFTEYCVPADPGPTRGLCGDRDTCFKMAGNLLLWDVCICWDSDQMCQGYGAGTNAGIYRKKCPLQSWAVPRATHMYASGVTKYKIESPGKSRHSRVVGGQGYN